MEIKVIASTKVGYVMPKDEAVDFSGKSAGICYLPDTLEILFSIIFLTFSMYEFISFRL